MAIRSRIAVKQGKVWKSVRVYWDGYPQGVGVELLDNYTTPESLETLLEIGHRSELIDDLEGETGWSRHDEFETLQDLMETFHQDSTEFLYHVDPSNEDEVGGWKCFSKYDNREINLIEVYAGTVEVRK